MIGGVESDITHELAAAAARRPLDESLLVTRRPIAGGADVYDRESVSHGRDEPCELARHAAPAPHCGCTDPASPRMAARSGGQRPRMPSLEAFQASVACRVGGDS